jgi:sugar/nucleoside kinase (ribokinase family)
VRDTSGAGDVFHGAYVYSYLRNKNQRWEEHFRFAAAASAFKIQHLGNEAGLPALSDVERVTQEFRRPQPVAERPIRAGAMR